MSVFSFFFSHYKRNRPRWQEPFFVVIFLASLTLLTFWPQLAQNQALYFGDVGLYFTPQIAFAHHTVSTGRLPLWNPLILCGTPFVGNPQSWLLYPFSIFLGIFDAPKFLNWTIAFHAFWAGLGAYWLGRKNEGVSAAAAMLGAATFAFGGQLLSKEQFPNMVQAASWLPWILIATGNLAKRAKVTDALTLGVALGLQILAAHAQMSLLTGYLALAYGLKTLASQPEKQIKRLAVLTIVTAIVALGISAGQLLPTLELLRDAGRQKLSLEAVNRFYLPWDRLTNFVLPYKNGHPYWDNFVGPGNYWETCCYVGTLPFTLALVGIGTAWKRKSGRFWIAVFLVGVWASMGAVAGLYGGFYWAVPGFRSFHDPARCLLWATFGLSILSAFGLDALRARLTLRDGRVLAAAILALAFFDLAHFDRTLYPLQPSESLFPVSPIVDAIQSDGQIQARQARVFAPDSAWTWHRFTNYDAFRRGVQNFPTLWADTLTPNLAMPYDLPDAFGYEPLARRDSLAISGTAAGAFLGKPDPIRRQVAADWAGFLSVRDVVLPDDSTPAVPIPHLNLVVTRPSLAPFDDVDPNSRVTLFRNSRFQPRARIVTQFVSMPISDDALNLLASTLHPPASLDIFRTTIITGNPPVSPASGPNLPADFVVSDGPNRVRVRVETSKPALLVLADTAAPGWTATLDGTPTPIFPADVVLRSVALPTPGPHRISFVYAPTSFRLGLYFSLLTLGILGGWGASNLKPKRKNTINQKRQTKKQTKKRAGLRGGLDE